jgi:uncharacterized repeat protein (TIGR01451 family)
VIGVDVTVPVAGTYTNTSGNLFVGTTDTGSYATDTLTVNTEPSPPPPPGTCTTPVTFATWQMPTSGQGSGGPPPPYTFKASDVALANASAGLTGSGTQSISTSGNPANSWQITDAWPATTGAPGGNNAPYFQFQLDTSNYGGITVTFDYDLEAPGDWASNANDHIYLYASQDGSTFSLVGTISATKGSWQANTVTTTLAGGTTWFRFMADTRNGLKSTATFGLDNVIFKGCQRPDPPTLAKSFSPNPIAVGGVSTLTFTLTNSSGTTLTGASFTDNLPAWVQVANPPNLVNSCGGTVNGATADSTSLSLSGGTIPAGGSCTVSVNVTATSGGPHPNTSGFISTNETGVNDGPGGSASATLTALYPPLIDKVFSPDLIAAGGVSTLTFTIINPNQDNPLTGVAFSDTFPSSGVVVASPPNAATSGCGSPSFAPVAGAGSISFSGGTIAAGGTCTVQVDVTAAAAGTYNNVSGAVTADIAGGSDTASATLTVHTPNPGLGFAKQIATASTGPWQNFVAVSAGASVYYRFVVENTGDVPLTHVSVSDPDINLSACSWHDGDGNPLTAPFTLPVADTDEGHIAYCVLGPFTAVSGSHTNTANAKSDQTAPVSDSAAYGTTGLTLVKSSLESSFTNVGDLIHYQYVVSNSGFAPLQGPVTVTDDKASVTCPDLTTVGDHDNFLDPGESITCTATYTVTAGDVTAGYVTNNAYATVQGVNSNTDTLTIYSSAGVFADLAITKDDGQTTYTPGGTLTYTITVTNNGPSNVTGATVTDTFPVTITSASWTCTGTGGATCTASGSGNITDTVDIPAGEHVTYTVTAQVDSGASGNLTNTASVAPPTGVTDPNSGNDTATDTDTEAAQADLAITKTDGQTTYTPGGTLTYTITVTNNGPSNVTGATVTDTFPAAIISASWTCVGSVPSATCTASGSGNINDTVTIPAGEYVTYTVTAQVDSGASGSLTNTASVAPPTGVTDPNAGNDTATDTDTEAAQADLAITKTDGQTTYTPGGTLTYTITVTNNGPSNVTGATVTDTFPAAIISASWTCVGSVPSATCTASGSGNINDTVTIPAGEYVTYTVTAQVSPSASGNLTNIASVAPPTGVTDPNSGNDTASDTDTEAAQADLAIAKDDSTATYTPGGTLTYTITVTNNGPSDAPGALVTDNIPAQFSSWTWTCTAQNGGASGCDGYGPGNANFSDTVNLPAGASITYTVSASVASSATGNLVNTVSVDPPSGVTDPNSGNNTASDTDTQNSQAAISVTKDDGVTEYVPGAR